MAARRARRRRFWRAWWRARSSAARCSAIGERLAGVEVGPLGGGQVRVGALAPLERSCEAGAAVELAVRAAHGVPGVGPAREVAEDALALDVLVEPALQPGPGPGQGLVGDLDDAVVAGDEPGADQPLDELVVGGVGGHGAPGHPAADALPIGARCDQAQHQVVDQRTLVGRDLLVERLGRLGDRPADAASGAVAVHGERASLAALPCGAQGV